MNPKSEYFIHTLTRLLSFSSGCVITVIPILLLIDELLSVGRATSSGTNGVRDGTGAKCTECGKSILVSGASESKKKFLFTPSAANYTRVANFAGHNSKINFTIVLYRIV